ncbi:MAG: DUF1311 domain-containing protein [Lachnospiraceae bacterium]|jgi:uncharacterized protein YecT (DUF1311 family)|nr:DUF1311 domain-containing protein [Lachnospiraceae bacterium]
MKKNVLKTITSILLISSLFACVGCGKKDVSSTDGTKKDQTEETVLSDSTEEMTDYVKDFLDKFAKVEKQAKELSDSIENDDLSQTEYNMKSGDLYTLWDDCLNELWGVLDKTLSKEEMAKLAEEENTWIADKEKQIADAGAEVEGGSMQPMLESLKGAELTENRIRELIKLLPGFENAGSSDESAKDDSSNGESSDKKKKYTFEDFLAGSGEVTISDKLANENVMNDTAYNAGNSFTLKTLISLNSLWEPVSGIDPKIQYTTFENKNGKLYGLSFEYKLESVTFTEFFVISENDGELKVNLVIDAWDRRYPMFNKYGVVFDDGSNGAGAHATNVYVPTKDFEYVMLYAQESNAPGWNFYDYDTQQEEQPITNIMNDVVATGLDNAEYVIFTKTEVNDKYYYYYLADDITQEMVDAIDGVAKNYEFTFDGKEATDAAVSQYAKELSVDDIYTNEDYAQWTDK